MTAVRRAMILAAGRGERMRPLTLTTPKPLLAVAGKPLIEWHLEHLARAGITDVAINISWLGDRLRNAVGDGRRHGLSITWFDEGPEPLEAAGGIINALGFFANEPFVVVNGDIFTDYALPPVAPQGGCLAHLVLVPNPVERPRGDFAVECGELRVDGARRYTFGCIATYHPAFFAGLAPGRRTLRPLLDRALGAGRVTAELFQGRWVDVGTPERLAALDSMLVAEAQIRG
jgi:MurNAc alpha-1-phosphate uridylyltransferase